MSYKGKWLVDYLRQYPKYRRYRQFKPMPPLALTFAVTHNCGSRCVMCNFWTKTEQNELSLQEIETLFKSPVMQSLETASLTGGDALMRKDLAEIVDIIVKYNPTISLGLGTAALMPKQLDEFLTKTKGKIKGVFISLDGLKDMHNRIRGREDSYDKTMESLEVMKKHGMGPNANMTVLEENHTQVLEAYRYYRSLGFEFSAKEAQTSETYFGDNHDHSFTLNADQRKALLDQMDQMDDHSLYDFYHRDWVARRERKLPCYAGHASLYIDSLGGIYPCIHKGAMGNIRQDRIEDIWYSSQAEELRRKYRHCTDCYARCTVDTFRIDEPRWVFKMRFDRWKKRFGQNKDVLS